MLAILAVLAPKTALRVAPLVSSPPLHAMARDVSGRGGKAGLPAELESLVHLIPRRTVSSSSTALRRAGADISMLGNQGTFLCWIDTGSTASCAAALASPRWSACWRGCTPTRPSC